MWFSSRTNFLFLKNCMFRFVLVKQSHKKSVIVHTALLPSLGQRIECSLWTPLPTYAEPNCFRQSAVSLIVIHFPRSSSVRLLRMKSQLSRFEPIFWLSMGSDFSLWPSCGGHIIGPEAGFLLGQHFFKKKNLLLDHLFLSQKSARQQLFGGDNSLFTWEISDHLRTHELEAVCFSNSVYTVQQGKITGFLKRRNGKKLVAFKEATGKESRKFQHIIDNV